MLGSDKSSTTPSKVAPSTSSSTALSCSSSNQKPKTTLISPSSIKNTKEETTSAKKCNTEKNKSKAQGVPHYQATCSNSISKVSIEPSSDISISISSKISSKNYKISGSSKIYIQDTYKDYSYLLQRPNMLEVIPSSKKDNNPNISSSSSQVKSLSGPTKTENPKTTVYLQGCRFVELKRYSKTLHMSIVRHVHQTIPKF